MTDIRKYRGVAVGVLIGVVATALVAWFVTGGTSKDKKSRHRDQASSPDWAQSAPAAGPQGNVSEAPAPVPTQASGPGTVRCPAATATVHDAGGLKRALGSAKPGDVIQLADGTYTGKFIIKASGTQQQPIFVCGGRGAVLDGGGIKKGYAFHLDGVSYVRVVGLTIQDTQKGVMADKSTNLVIQGLVVHDIGDEAIHLRNFSTDNLVVGNTISRTGKRREKFGEGIYFGTAQSNWGQYSGGVPDKSDRNVARGNKIQATAEAIDVKEGTTGGSIIGNTFDGSAMAAAGADSWVDVKGNGYVIEGNTGSKSLQDGFQVHKILDGWGTGNVFRNNVADVQGPGFGIHIAGADGDKVECNNKATNAGKGLSNDKCS